MERTETEKDQLLTSQKLYIEEEEREEEGNKYG